MKNSPIEVLLIEVNKREEKIYCTVEVGTKAYCRYFDLNDGESVMEMYNRIKLDNTAKEDLI